MIRQTLFGKVALFVIFMNGNAMALENADKYDEACSTVTQIVLANEAKLHPELPNLVGLCNEHPAQKYCKEADLVMKVVGNSPLSCTGINRPHTNTDPLAGLKKKYEEACKAAQDEIVSRRPSDLAALQGNIKTCNESPIITYCILADDFVKERTGKRSFDCGSLPQ